MGCGIGDGIFVPLWLMRWVCGALGLVYIFLPVSLVRVLYRTVVRGVGKGIHYGDFSIGFWVRLGTGLLILLVVFGFGFTLWFFRRAHGWVGCILCLLAGVMEGSEGVFERLEERCWVGLDLATGLGWM